MASGFEFHDRTVPGQNAIRRENIAVVGFELDLAPLHAAAGVDLVDGQVGAVEIIGVVGDLCRDNGQADRRVGGGEPRRDERCRKRCRQCGADPLDDSAASWRPMPIGHAVPRVS